MAALRGLLFLGLILLSLRAGADLERWGVSSGVGGYMGEVFLGGYRRFNERHLLELSLGSYTINKDTRAQMNILYIYSPWLEPYSQGYWQWNPVDLGVSLVFSLDRDHYFLRSPVQYPETNYYDQTVNRGGLQLGSTLHIGDGFSIRYFVSDLVFGAIAVFNNRQTYQQFYSSGVSLKFAF